VRPKSSQRLYVGRAASAVTVVALIVFALPLSGASAERTSDLARTPVALPTPVPTAAVVAMLSLSPTVGSRGTTILVSGAGFLARETITVFVQGSSTDTVSTQANAGGELTPTSFVVPYAVSPGLRTIVARGTTSKRQARATIVIQPLSPRITLGTAMVSPGAVETVSGAGFGVDEPIVLTINGAPLETTPASITASSGAFTAIFVVPPALLNGDNTVAARGLDSRTIALAPLTGVLPIVSQYYFSGGLNDSTGHSDLAVLNPNDAPAHLQLTFYFGDGTSLLKDVPAIAAHSQTLLSTANFDLPPGTFGLEIGGDRAVSAQLDLLRDGRDGDNIAPVQSLARTWYLAEGYTGATFEENVSILNTDATEAAHVVLHLEPNGSHEVDKTVVVPAHSNIVQNINALFPHASLAIVAQSDRPVLMERSSTFSTDGYGLTASAGVATPRTAWTFAEGTTANHFETFLTILNPNDISTSVTSNFYGAAGQSLGFKKTTVLAHARATLRYNDFLHASSIAAVVKATLPIVVERPEYFGSPNDHTVAGSDVFGISAANTRWSFPGGSRIATEGAVSPTVSEYLLLYNPLTTTTAVTATFYDAAGHVVVKKLSVSPTTRFTLNVGTLLPTLSPAHGVVLESPPGSPFVAEQTVFAEDYSTLRTTAGLPG